MARTRPSSAYFSNLSLKLSVLQYIYYPVPGRVSSSTAACAAPGRVCPTAVCAVLERVSSTTVCTALHYPLTCLFYRSL
jgi:hypothetical protein